MKSEFIFHFKLPSNIRFDIQQVLHLQGKDTDAEAVILDSLKILEACRYFNDNRYMCYLDVSFLSGV